MAFPDVMGFPLTTLIVLSLNYFRPRAAISVKLFSKALWIAFTSRSSPVRKWSNRWAGNFWPIAFLNRASLHLFVVLLYLLAHLVNFFDEFFIRHGFNLGFINIVVCDVVNIMQIGSFIIQMPIVSRVTFLINYLLTAYWVTLRFFGLELKL